MNTDSATDLAIFRADARRTAHLANPDRAWLMQEMADRIAANKANNIPTGRHKAATR